MFGYSTSHPLKNDCCTLTTDVLLRHHVVHGPGERHPCFWMHCPECGEQAAVILFRLRAENLPSTLLLEGGLYHHLACWYTTTRATPYADGDWAEVFQRTLFKDGEPQPCPNCLGREVEQYLGWGQ